MVKSEYYRRQADLCRRLALAQRDRKTAIWLAEFAEELTTKARAAADLHATSSKHVHATAPREGTLANL